MDQVAALPYRLDHEGRMEVMLITSRRTQRWVIPKGNPMKGMQAQESAACEAFEEAGLIGLAAPEAIGIFCYRKRRSSGAELKVTVFPMLVTDEAKDWPERQERERRWLDPKTASVLVHAPGLKKLILAFEPKRLRD
jgi:8-oxo-dGTP pyrophosphatase MutT (NUDIX family)